MPNWCYNRITIYGDEKTEAKLKEIEEIFEKENPFNEIYPIPDFKNIPNEKGELPKLEQHKNDNGSGMFGKHTIFQMVRMMIGGICGVLTTGEQSGMLATNPLSMKTRRFLHLHSILRGVHPKELLKSYVRSTQT